MGKKAYEMAYALFRISAKILESSVKEKLESQAIDLLISANIEEYGNTAKAVAAIDALVKFAIDLNMISISNGDVLLREIAAMNGIIAGCLDKSDEVDVSKFFSPAAQEKQVDTVIPGSARNLIRHSEPREESQWHSPSEILRKAQDDKKEENSKAQSGNPAIALKSGNRQIAILDKIRQSGNCKLRDIQEVLPDCSERTIRYDLEELIERDIVERIGSGGPAISYRMRQIA